MNILVLCFTLLVTACFAEPARTFRAGAAQVDITPTEFPVWVSGGFLAKRGTKAHDRLHSRAIVLDDGRTKIALVIVDSLMFRRELLDPIKAQATDATGIPSTHILIAATHTHSAPSVMGALGTPVDENYYKFLPPRILESIVQADKNRQPAKVGWAAVKDYRHNHCRRWIYRPDRIQSDPFGDRNVRAMMHPGVASPNHTGPSGPADADFSVLSVQGIDGTPIAVLGNYAMHYRGAAAVSADVCGRFGDAFAKLIELPPNAPFVGALSQGTSGDSMWRNYEKSTSTPNLDGYAVELAMSARRAYDTIEYRNWVSLAAAETALKLRRRTPSEERLTKSRTIAERIKGVPRSRPDVYALEAIYVHEEPVVELKLQALRIGDLGITALPNEVYGLTGIKLKLQSPLPLTFNIELANGAQGYIPPPEQHHLGGYTTWPARTAGLEVEAEPRIVETLIGLLEKVSGKPRQMRTIPEDDYLKAVRASKPQSLWRMDDLTGATCTDAIGKNNATYEMGVAFYLPGRSGADLEFSEMAPSRSAQFAGGRAIVGFNGSEAYTLEFWFWNGMQVNARGIAGTLFEMNEADVNGTPRPGEQLFLTGTDSLPGFLAFKDSRGITTIGKTPIAYRQWHHVVVIKRPEHFELYLNGVEHPEIQGSAPPLPNAARGLYLGGTFNNENNWEGKLDDVAYYNRPLSSQEVATHYKASGLTPPPIPKPPAVAAFYPTRPESADDLAEYAKAIGRSKPVARWTLHQSLEGVVPDADGRDLQLTQAANSSIRKPGDTKPNFTGGRMKGQLKLGNDYSVEMWFWNELPVNARPVTGYFFSRGPDGPKTAPGEHLGIGGTHLAIGKLMVFNGNDRNEVLEGTTRLPLRSWNHVVLTREAKRVRVYLNGNAEPDIDADLVRTFSTENMDVFIGGRSDLFAPFQGRIDLVSVYDRALSAEEASAHFEALKPVAVKKNTTQVPATPSSGPESPPLSPADSLKTINIKDGYQIQLVASEPQVIDPVAIDWGPDAKLWVAEMADYPLGMDGKGKPGGRIRVLEDRDKDGQYEHSTLFLDGVRFPTGVLAWKKGVLITAAPDILYAEDTDGDGRADLQKVLFTGFNEGNQQLRVNGLRWGLDNWIYCASGGHHARYGTDRKVKIVETGETIDVGSRDFRFRLDPPKLEPQSGPSQFGRNRDDWGNWFGVQNSNPLWHYVLRDHYIRRNPHFAPPDPRRQLRTPQNPQVFPAKAPQKRYHGFNQSGRFTSACSAIIYRDELLFPRDEIHAFTCEPFHNLVQHHVLEPDGVSFTAKRADDGPIDFFASTDRWCRPVMVRTGPDGALWVVDMYRYMIEHPQWLPANGKKELLPYYRSGADRGRIYRVVPDGKTPQPVRALDKLTSAELVASLSSNSGSERDLIHRLIIAGVVVNAVQPLSVFWKSDAPPHSRLAALCILDGLGSLTEKTILEAINGKHPGIRRHGIRLAEQLDGESAEFKTSMKNLAREEADQAVKLQLAFSLGAWTNKQSVELLNALTAQSVDDPFILAACMTSTGSGNIVQRDRVQLSKIRNTDIGKHISQLAKSPEMTRPEAWKKYSESLKLKPDATKGAAIFLKVCATCHRYKEVGHEVGPNLASLTDRRKESLLRAILEPSQTIEPKFLNYAVLTKDEQTFVGIIVSETATSLTLLQPSAVKHTVLRKDIEAIKSTGESLMPIGLEQALSIQDMADLLEWISK